jgi:hypothetical protein
MEGPRTPIARKLKTLFNFPSCVEVVARESRLAGAMEHWDGERSPGWFDAEYGSIRISAAGPFLSRNIYIPVRSLLDITDSDTELG